MARHDRRKVAFSFQDMLNYHGAASPGGVAHAFTVLQCALPLLDDDACVERREINIETAFGGPGALDAFELVTRAVTEDRFTVNSALARPEYGGHAEVIYELGATHVLVARRYIRPSSDRR
jgi:hypothetical protein